MKTFYYLALEKILDLSIGSVFQNSSGILLIFLVLYQLSQDLENIKRNVLSDLILLNTGPNITKKCIQQNTPQGQIMQHYVDF